MKVINLLNFFLERNKFNLNFKLNFFDKIASMIYNKVDLLILEILSIVYLAVNLFRGKKRGVTWKVVEI